MSFKALLIYNCIESEYQSNWTDSEYVNRSRTKD